MAERGYRGSILSKTRKAYRARPARLTCAIAASTIKFKVDANGKFDNGIATANKLGSNRVIVPVQVIGNQDAWDQTAWKTCAFYGSPLTGFTAP